MQRAAPFGRRSLHLLYSICMKTSKKTTYRMRARVWRWPGENGWHFITLPREMSAQIREHYGKGMIPIHATVKKATWDTSLFPHKESHGYLLSIKKAVREKEGVYEGDMIVVSFEVAFTSQK